MAAKTDPGLLYVVHVQSSHLTSVLSCSQVYLPPEVLLGTSPPEDAAAAGAAAQVGWEQHFCQRAAMCNALLPL